MYRVLFHSSFVPFPHRSIWNPIVPPKMDFFSWGNLLGWGVGEFKGFFFCEGCSIGFLSPCLFPVGLPFVYPNIPSVLFFLINILPFIDKKKKKKITDACVCVYNDSILKYTFFLNGKKRSILKKSSKIVARKVQRVTLPLPKTISNIGENTKNYCLLLALMQSIN